MMFKRRELGSITFAEPYVPNQAAEDCYQVKVGNTVVLKPNDAEDIEVTVVSVAGDKYTGTIVDSGIHVEFSEEKIFFCIK